MNLSRTFDVERTVWMHEINLCIYIEKQHLNRSPNVRQALQNALKVASSQPPGDRYASREKCPRLPIAGTTQEDARVPVWHVFVSYQLVLADRLLCPHA